MGIEWRQVLLEGLFVDQTRNNDKNLTLLFIIDAFCLAYSAFEGIYHCFTTTQLFLSLSVFISLTKLTAF